MGLVLAVGFDLFFRPRLVQAAKAAGVDVTFDDADAARAERVVADASAPGALASLQRIRDARPDLPVLACYPHVEVDVAEAVKRSGGAVVTRGAFNANLAGALAGEWP